MGICIIGQPGGLGDIMFIQPIIDKYIKDGYEVHYPVLSEYYPIVKEYIVKDKLIWHDENSSFPLRERWGWPQEFNDGENIYLPLMDADNYIISNAPNIAKYFYTNTPLSDWRNSLDIKRNYEREEALIKKYNLYEDYIIVNEEFTSIPFIRPIIIDSDMPVHRMSWEQDKENGFNIFDWISALQNAKQIHSVGTSLCYIVDKYCLDNEIFIYERRLPGQNRNYHRDHYIVYRNPNWVYMD
jgi:hypothetical protein